MKAIYHQFEPVIARWILIAIVLALVLLIASVAAACPTCKDGLAQNDPQGRGLAAGISYSIIFMMTMPYLVLATFLSVAYLSIRRAKANAADSPSPLDPDQPFFTPPANAAPNL